MSELAPHGLPARLREGIDREEIEEAEAVMDAAADEIDRLRAEIEQLKILIAARDELLSVKDRPSPEGLSLEEKLIWQLGNLMDNVENYYGVPNQKREGHIYSTAIRILDDAILAKTAKDPLNLAGQLMEARQEIDRLRAELAVANKFMDLDADDYSVLKEECENLRAETETLRAQMHGMQDGSLVLDQNAEIDRLRAEKAKLRESLYAMAVAADGAAVLLKATCPDETSSISCKVREARAMLAKTEKEGD